MVLTVGREQAVAQFRQNCRTLILAGTALPLRFGLHNSSHLIRFPQRLFRVPLARQCSYGLHLVVSLGAIVQDRLISRKVISTFTKNKQFVAFGKSTGKARGTHDLHKKFF
jgi:hypothetical protein